MLPSEEARKFPIKCPRCEQEVTIGDFGWLSIFDDLDMFGKTVVECDKCRRLFIIREEDDSGPFVTK